MFGRGKNSLRIATRCDKELLKNVAWDSITANARESLCRQRLLILGGGARFPVALDDPRTTLRRAFPFTGLLERVAVFVSASPASPPVPSVESALEPRVAVA